MNVFIKIGLSLAIAIVIPFTVGLGIEAFYPTPEPAYEKCRSLQPNGAATDYTEFDKCMKDNEVPQKEYDRNVFLITTVLGFIAIAGGTLYFGQSLGQVLSPGLVFGGIFTLLYGSGRSFNAVDKRLLFLELVLVLIGLVFVAQRFLKKQNHS